MEIKTKYNVGDKVWIMRNNKPEKIQISNIEVEVIGDVPVGTCSLSGEYYTKIIYVEVQRSEYRSFGDKDPICKHNECNCFNTKKDLLYSFLDDTDIGSVTLRSLEKLRLHLLIVYVLLLCHATTLV